MMMELWIMYEYNIVQVVLHKKYFYSILTHIFEVNTTFYNIFSKISWRVHLPNWICGYPMWRMSHLSWLPKWILQKPLGVYLFWGKITCIYLERKYLLSGIYSRRILIYSYIYISRDVQRFDKILSRYSRVSIWLEVNEHRLLHVFRQT